MSNRDANQGEPNQQTLVRSEKRIIGADEEGDPELEPLFANHFELMQIGTDLYLDIGIVRPADIVGLHSRIETAPAETPTITFNVLQRIAMSRDGFDRLRASVELIARGMDGGKGVD